MSERETVAYECLEELGLAGLIVPYRRDGGLLRSEPADRLLHEDIELCGLYRECLQQLYAVRSGRFSPGIYSFYASGGLPEDGEPYCDYLLRQVRAFVESVRPLDDPILDQFERLFYSGAQRLERSLRAVDSFSLLHGDLYSQNILRCHGQYRLIDPEYLRFGPVSLELAFLICWDSFCGDSPLPERGDFSRDLSLLKSGGIVTEEECGLIAGVFIPMFACLAQAACKAGRFRAPESILLSLSRLAALWREAP